MNRLKVFSLFLLVTFTVFFPALAGDFLYWDDTMNIRDNTMMVQGDVAYFWKNQHFNIYIPVTYTVWTVVLQIWKSPLAFHILNLLIHAVNALLLFELVRKIWPKEKTMLAWICALIFLVHPMQNEAVAWISGGRDILGALFSLLAANVLFVSARARYVAASTLLFIVSLLAKPTLVTFPAALLFLQSVRGMLLRPQKIALVGWILIAGVFALLARSIQSGITERLVPPLPFYQDLIIGFDSLGFYLSKIIWPFNLTSDYGRSPEKVIGEQLYWPHLGVVVAVAIGAWLARGLRPKWSWDGLLFFFVALSPLLGFVPFMAQSQSTVADRYMYWAWIGPAILLAQAAVSSKWTLRASIVLLILWAGLSFQRSFVYENNYEFFTQMLNYNPDSYVGNNSMGVVHFEAGNSKLAEEHIMRAHKVMPLHPTAASNLAQLYFINRQFGRIQTELEPLLKNPEFVKNNVANPDSLNKMYKFVARSQSMQGRLVDANISYCQYLKLDPWDRDAAGEFERLIREMKARGLNVVPCL